MGQSRKAKRLQASATAYRRLAAKAWRAGNLKQFSLYEEKARKLTEQAKRS